MENTNKNSAARIAANHRYDEENYDRFTVRFPKGTKKQIQDTGKSLNSFIVETVLEKLEQVGK